MLNWVELAKVSQSASGRLPPTGETSVRFPEIVCAVSMVWLGRKRSVSRAAGISGGPLPLDRPPPFHPAIRRVPLHHPLDHRLHAGDAAREGVTHGLADLVDKAPHRWPFLMQLHRQFRAVVHPPRGLRRCAVVRSSPASCRRSAGSSPFWIARAMPRVTSAAWLRNSIALAFGVCRERLRAMFR